jgi:hypothetical protein
VAYLDSGGSFDPHMILVLEHALERAWAKVGTARALTATGQPITREMIARRLVKLAHNGDRDPLMLAEKALTELHGTSHSLTSVANGR